MAGIEAGEKLTTQLTLAHLRRIWRNNRSTYRRGALLQRMIDRAIADTNSNHNSQGPHGT